YFEISALYFKIHGLYFLQDALCFFSDRRIASKKLILSPGNKDVVLENYAKQSPCKDAENELFRTFAQDI
ncbi:MAG: hypothetical protein DBY24_00025, partial [Prevotellaceae bacterium]